MYLKVVGKNIQSEGAHSKQPVLPTKFGGTLQLIWHINKTHNKVFVLEAQHRE